MKWPKSVGHNKTLGSFIPSLDMKILRDAVHAEGFLFYWVIDLLLASQATVAAAHKDFVELGQQGVGPLPMRKAEAIPVRVLLGVLNRSVVNLPKLRQLLRPHRHHLLGRRRLENRMLTPR